TFCVAALARHRAHTFAKRTAISFNLRNGGNLTGFVWPAISRERKKHCCCFRRRERKLSRGSAGRPFQITASIAVQVFLRRARRAVVPTDLRSARILRYSNRDRDSTLAWRRYGKGARSTGRTDRTRHRCRNEDANPARRVAQSGCIRANRHFQGTVGEILVPVSRNVPGVASPAGFRRLSGTVRVAIAAPTLFSKCHL